MSGSNHRVQIIVALIGLIGVIAGAMFANWDKIFGQSDNGRTTPPSVPGGTQTSKPQCKNGFVLRMAGPSDYICVTRERYGEVQSENRLAAARVNPQGGAYGPDTCKQGFVWREAFENDHVCVTGESRSAAQEENRLHRRRVKI